VRLFLRSQPRLLLTDAGEHFLLRAQASSASSTKLRRRWSSPTPSRAGRR